MGDEIDVDKIKDDQDEFPDHIPIIPYDLTREKEKERQRKLADELRKKMGVIEPVITTKDGVTKKASQLTVEEQEHEIVRCKTDPIYFIETYLTIFDQTQGKDGLIVPFRLFSFQKNLIHTYVDNRFVVANKYRQAGITTTTCGYIAWYIMFNRNRQVAIVADKLETARDEVMSDVVLFIEGCPEWLRPKTGRVADKNLKDTQKDKIYDNNSRLAAFSSKGLRGMTPTLIFWDETAWTEKGDKFWTAAKPTLGTGGHAIMVSTPSGLDAVFYKHFDGARRGENSFEPVEIWWFNDPRYNKDLCWLKNKGKETEIRKEDLGFSDEERIKLMDEGWEASSPWFEEQVRDANGDMRKIAQELLCSFLGSGDNFISEEFLKRIQEDEVLPPVRQEYVDKNMWIWEDPIPGEEYIMALDASPGHGEDNSTINMLKTIEEISEREITKNGSSKMVKIKRHRLEQVAEYYGKITPQQLAEVAMQFGKRYNFAYCVVDITGGYGVQSIEKLFEYGYSDEHIHYAEVSHKPSRDRLQGYVKKGQKRMSDGSVVTVDLIPGFFVGGNRASVVLEMQRAIHMEDVIIHSVRLLNELKTFVTVPGNRVADHKRSFHDDSIMGLSIGLYVLNFDMARFKQSKSFTEKMLNAMIKVNDVDEMRKRMESGNTNTIKDNNTRLIRDTTVKNRPMISPDSVNPLNPYGVNAWLFDGIKDKKKT
jgi:hypothetical protein